MDWLMVWGLKEGLVECATLCVKSWVTLTYWSADSDPGLFTLKADQQYSRIQATYFNAFQLKITFVIIFVILYSLLSY